MVCFIFLKSLTDKGFQHIWCFEKVIACSTLQIFNMLKEQDLNQKRGLKLDGQYVCQKSFRLILGIGKSRMGKLRHAVIMNHDCPGDGRYTPKVSFDPKLQEQRSAVVSFLTTCYNTMAESLPEAVQDRRPGDLIALQGKRKLKRRGKRPRSVRKQEEGGSGYAPGMKFLPPGTILMYWDLCKSEHPELNIGRKLFTRVPGEVMSEIFFLISLILRL